MRIRSGCFRFSLATRRADRSFFRSAQDAFPGRAVRSVWLLVLCASIACCSGSGGPDLRGRAGPPEQGAFLFGVAISGFQADMGCPTLPPEVCADTGTDWYRFILSPEILRDPLTFVSGQDPARVGPGHWELYETDFDLAAKELHLNAFRTSLEWSRIFPSPTFGVEGYENLRALADPEAVDHYHQVFRAMRARGLTPFVTLNHYTLPAWIHDGVGCHFDLEACSPRGWLEGERMVAEIAKFAGFAAQEFGGEVDLWATQNEPLAVLLPGYLYPSPERTNPPAVLLEAGAMKAALGSMVEAHARMYDAVKAGDQADADRDGRCAEGGIVYAMAPVFPKDPDKPLDREAARNVFYLWNEAFLNAVLLGRFDGELNGEAVLREDLAGRMDFMGINYYARITVEGLPFSFLPSLSPLANFNPLTLSYAVYPRGLYEMADWVRSRKEIPVYITENNGQNDPENTLEKENKALVEHLYWLSYARDRGVDIRGYFYWALMDNFEWNRGMAPYGLFRVDPEDPLKRRVARETAVLYSEIVRTGILPPELCEPCSTRVETIHP
jgi:beta-galactosidase